MHILALHVQLWSLHAIGHVLPDDKQTNKTNHIDTRIPFPCTKKNSIPIPFFPFPYL